MDNRLEDLLRRLISKGPKCNNVSCSETHEIVDITFELQQKHDELAAHVERLREALKDYADEENYDVDYVRYRAGPINGHDGYSVITTDVDWNSANEALSETQDYSLNHIKAQIEEETIDMCVLEWREKGYLNRREMPRKYKEQSNED